VEENMKKYVIPASAIAVILVAVSVFAFQIRKGGQTGVAREVAPLAASASSSGCGVDGSGCGYDASAGCPGASGGCGTEALSPEDARVRTDRISAYLRDYYTGKLGYDDIQVKVDDFGCHQEATVTSGGKLVEKLSISGSRITKLEG